MKAFSLTYAISDTETRAFAKGNFTHIARELWDDNVSSMPETLRRIGRQMVASEDSIVKPISDGAL